MTFCLELETWEQGDKIRFWGERDKTAWKFRNGKQIWGQYGEEGCFLCRVLVNTNAPSGEAEELKAWEQ